MDFRVTKMCYALKVSTSGYYKWREKEKKVRCKKEEIIEHIVRVFHENRKVYGSPRITNEIHKIGIKVSEKTVARYMKKLGLNAVYRLHYTVTTNSNHNEHYLPKPFKT